MSSTEAAPGLHAHAQPPVVFRGGSSGAKSPAERQLVVGELAGTGGHCCWDMRRGQNDAESRRDTAEKGLLAAGQVRSFVSCSNNSNCCKPKNEGLWRKKQPWRRRKAPCLLLRGLSFQLGFLGKLLPVCVCHQPSSSLTHRGFTKPEH